MADVDNSNAPDTKVDPTEEIRKTVDSKLAEVQAQLEAMNQQFANSLQTITKSMAPAPVTEVSDDDFFEPKKLKEKILAEATKTAQEMLMEDRRKNATIYQLAQEYPEIQTDRDLQKAILDAQKALPKSLQDTADGYELAVMKAIAKQGVLPKSKRQVVDEDVSSGSGRGSRQTSASKPAKLSEKTIAVAELLRGRALTDEEMKSLEVTSKRDSYGKYR